MYVCIHSHLLGFAGVIFISSNFLDVVSHLKLDFLSRILYRDRFVERYCLNLTLPWNILFSMMISLSIVVWATFVAYHGMQDIYLGLLTFRVLIEKLAILLNSLIAYFLYSLFKDFYHLHKFSLKIFFLLLQACWNILSML